MKLKSFNLSIGTQVLKALSDESRVRILNLIYFNKEMCISDLEQILDFTQTKVSRHMSYLKNAGLLRYRKRDQWIYYYIKEEYFTIVEQLMALFEKDQILEEDQANFNTLYANNILAIRKVHNQEKKYKLPNL